MKYWLIMFFLTPDGEFIHKDVYSAPSKEVCEKAAQQITRRIKALGKYNVEYHCVSDDHYTGKKQDPGVPYD